MRPPLCLTFDKNDQQEPSQEQEGEQVQDQVDVVISQASCERKSGLLSMIKFLPYADSRTGDQHPPPPAHESNSQILPPHGP